MAAMAGPRTALDPTCSSFAATIPRNDGARAISSALAPMPATATMAALRLEGTVSTSQPPGSWLTRPGDTSDRQHQADIGLVPLLRGEIDRQERPEPRLHVGNEEREPIEAPLTLPGRGLHGCGSLRACATA